MVFKIFGKTPQNDPTSLAIPTTLLSQPLKFVAIDVETANYDPGSICQIGIATVDQRNEINVFSWLVDPETYFEPRNIRIHGITPTQVVGHPTFKTLFPELAPFLANHTLIQHSNFDKRAITAACKENDVEMPPMSWKDSVQIAKKAWPELSGNGGHGLKNLKKVLKLDFKHHDAGEDAMAAAQVVLLAEAGIKPHVSATATAGWKTYQKSVALNGVEGAPLWGHTAVFTGELSMSRLQASEIAAQVGISVRTSVSKKVNLLVVGDPDITRMSAGERKSAKHRRAEELMDQGHDIRIIGESDFIEMIAAHMDEA